MNKHKPLSMIPSLKNVSYIANIILLFAIIVDSTNALLGIKDVAFIFFVAVSFPYARFKNVYILVIFCMIYFVTLSAGILSQQQIDYDFALGTLKSFVFLSYLFWMNDDYLKVFSVFYNLTLLISGIVIVLYGLILLFPFLEGIFYSFFHEKSEQASAVAMSYRTFLGIKAFYIYYRTSPTCIISLSIALYFLFYKKNPKYFFHSCILFLCLILSGARANMLSAILIVVFFVLLYFLHYKKAILSFIIWFCIASLSGMVLIIRLLTDNERSVEVKAGHSESILSLFSDNPIQFLLVGTGPGSLFYSMGIGKITAQTELTYLELIRNYGLLFTLLIILLLCVPFINIANNKHYEKVLKIALSTGYLAYLFIAGTNPLIISSTGIVVIAIIFYISKKNILKEMG